MSNHLVVQVKTEVVTIRKPFCVMSHRFPSPRTLNDSRLARFVALGLFLAVGRQSLARGADAPR